MQWTSSELALAPEYVDRVRALAPAIVAAADETERERRVAASLMATLHEARLFRLLLPRSLDGAELDPITDVRVIEEVAKADASTAWCLNQNCVCSMIAGYLEPAARARDLRPPRCGPGVGLAGRRRLRPGHGRRVSGDGHVELRERRPARHVAGRALPDRGRRRPPAPST